MFAEASPGVDESGPDYAIEDYGADYDRGEEGGDDDEFDLSTDEF